MSDKPYKDPGRGVWTSASNAEADALCPGRHWIQRGLPDIQGEWADQGNAIHDALCSGDPSKLTLEQHDMYESCKAIEAKLVDRYFGLSVPEKLAVIRERRWMTTIPVNATQAVGHSGKSDVVYRNGAKALILDYKSLSGQVAESPRNLQLRDLAVLFRGNTVGIVEIAVALIQPLVTHSPELVVYSGDDLDRSEKEMIARVLASNDANAPRKAGDAQCKYCKAKKLCMEYSNYAGSLLPAQVGEPLLQSLAFQTPMASWTPEQCSQVAAMIPASVKVIDEIKDYLKAKLDKDPASIPGWYLAEGAKKEAIVDAQKAFERFIALGGKLEGFMTCINVVKGRLKEAVAATTGKKGKALDTDIKTLCDGITEVSQNAPSLKRKEAE